MVIGTRLTRPLFCGILIRPRNGAGATKEGVVERTKEEKRDDFVRAKKPLFVLFWLYLSQGLPFGFAAAALPLFLQERGLSMTQLGFAGALSAPWVAKFAWAPLLDRYYSPTFGRRKSWIVPMQCLLLAAVIVTGLLMPGNIAVLAASVFVMNMCAATQDIAVDGFAIDQLKPHALGLGNAAQSFGFKIGSMLSGGLLLMVAAAYGWGSLIAVMATLILLALIPIALFKEKPIADSASLGLAAELSEKPTLGDFYRRMLQLVTGKAFRVIVVFIFTYKIGEELTQSMFNPFLVKSGFTIDEVGAMMGTSGTITSFAGSAAGALLIVKYSPWKLLGVAGVLRLLPLAWQWWLTQGTITSLDVVMAAGSEHFCGGLMTTSMYAFMMGLTNKKAGATEYTAMGCIENVGRYPGKFASGIMADAWGFGVLFILGLLVSAAALLPWWLCRKLGTAADDAVRADPSASGAEAISAVEKS